MIWTSNMFVLSCLPCACWLVAGWPLCPDYRPSGVPPQATWNRGWEQRGLEEANETLLRLQQDWCLVRIFGVTKVLWLVSHRIFKNLWVDTCCRDMILESHCAGSLGADLLLPPMDNAASTFYGRVDHKPQRENCSFPSCNAIPPRTKIRTQTNPG